MGVFDSLDSGGQTVTTTQNSEPWAAQQPYLKTGFEQALFNLNQPKQYYTGQTVADTSAATQTGWDAAQAQAGAHSSLNSTTMGGGFFDQNNPLYAGAQGMVDSAVGPRDPGQNHVNQVIGNIAAGGSLGQQNPHFQAMIDQIGRSIRPGIDSMFAGAGRLGSGAHANAFASAMADQGGKLAYQDYDAGRQQQMQAANLVSNNYNTAYGQQLQQAGLGQSLYGNERQAQIGAAQDYSPFQTFMGVGAAQEAKQGQYLADGMARWNFDQNEPDAALNQYMNLVGGKSFGGQESKTTPMEGNSALSGVATGLAGLGALGQGMPGLLKLFGK